MANLDVTISELVAGGKLPPVAIPIQQESIKLLNPAREAIIEVRAHVRIFVNDAAISLGNAKNTKRLSTVREYIDETSQRSKWVKKLIDRNYGIISNASDKISQRSNDIEKVHKDLSALNVRLTVERDAAQGRANRNSARAANGFAATTHGRGYAPARSRRSFVDSKSLKKVADCNKQISLNNQFISATNRLRNELWDATSKLSSIKNAVNLMSSENDAVLGDIDSGKANSDAVRIFLLAAITENSKLSDDVA